MVKRGPLLGLKHQKEKRSMDHFAGLDVSVKETSICIVDDTGRIVREVKVASEPEALLQVLGNPNYRFKRIGLEAGPLPCGPPRSRKRRREKSDASATAHRHVVVLSGKLASSGSPEPAAELQARSLPS